MQDNKDAWENPPPPHTELESNLFKTTALFNKLRTINATNYQEVEKDALKLRLDKFTDELGDALGVAATKVSKIVDIEALVSIFGVFHRFLGPPFTTGAVRKALKALEETGKLRTTLRISLDLYVEGLILDPAVITANLEPVLQPRKSPPHATIKLLTGYKGHLSLFEPLLQRYAAHLEKTLWPEMRQRSSLLLSEEIQRIDEEYRERLENIRAYVELSELLGRPADPDLVAHLSDPRPEAPKPRAPSQLEPLVGSEGPDQPEESASQPGTAPTIKWSTLEKMLCSMNSPESVEAAAAAFTGDATLTKKVHAFFAARPKAHSLPYYSLFLSLVPELAERVVPEVLRRRSDPTYLKFAAELAKVGILSPDEAMDILIRLSRNQFRHQLVYTYLRVCGSFLLSKPELESRIADFRGFLKDLTASAAHERQLIDGSISILAPPAPPVRKVAPAVDLRSFVQLILYRDLDDSVLSKASRVLSKIPLEDTAALAPLFVDCTAIPKDNLENVSHIIQFVSVHNPRFAYQVLDIALDRFLADLESDERQALVSQAVLLGKLHARAIIDYRLVKSIVDGIFNGPRLQFRLKLAAIFLLETDAKELNVPELQAAIGAYKGKMVIDKDFVVTFNAAIAHLRRHAPPAVATDSTEEEMEEEDLETEGFDQEFADEEFEREFSEMCGETKEEDLNEHPPAKPFVIDFANLKIARH